jgi:hypothetical protein
MNDTGEYVYQNVHDFDLPWLEPAPRLSDPVAQGHGAYVSRIIGDGERACRRCGRRSAIFTAAETGGKLLTTRSR